MMGIYLLQAAAAFLSQPNPGKYSAPGCSDFNSMSPRSGSMSQSPMLTSSGFNAMNGFGEVHRLREELNVNKAKLNQWEEGIAQARNVSSFYQSQNLTKSKVFGYGFKKLQKKVALN